MTAMNLSNVMDGLGVLLATVAQNVWSYPPESIQTPAVVVGLPEAVDFDLTFQNGGNEATFPIFFIVGRAFTKDTRDALSDAINGVTSVKALLDGSHSFGDVRVEDAKPINLTYSGVEYIALEFRVNVIS